MSLRADAKRNLTRARDVLQRAVWPDSLVVPAMKLMTMMSI